MDGIHYDLRNHECGICKKRFVVKTHLLRHKREVHLGKKVARKNQIVGQQAKINQNPKVVLQRDQTSIKIEFGKGQNIISDFKVDMGLDYVRTQITPKKPVIQPIKNQKWVSETVVDVKNEFEDGQIPINSIFKFNSTHAQVQN